MSKKTSKPCVDDTQRPVTRRAFTCNDVIHRNCHADYFIITRGAEGCKKVINPLSPSQNGRYFADNIFRWTFFNQSFVFQFQFNCLTKSTHSQISAKDTFSILISMYHGGQNYLIYTLFSTVNNNDCSWTHPLCFISHIYSLYTSLLWQGPIPPYIFIRRNPNLFSHPNSKSRSLLSGHVQILYWSDSQIHTGTNWQLNLNCGWRS